MLIKQYSQPAECESHSSVRTELNEVWLLWKINQAAFCLHDNDKTENNLFLTSISLVYCFLQWSSEWQAEKTSECVSHSHSGCVICLFGSCQTGVWSLWHQECFLSDLTPFLKDPYSKIIDGSHICLHCASCFSLNNWIMH